MMRLSHLVDHFSVFCFSDVNKRLARIEVCFYFSLLCLKTPDRMISVSISLLFSSWLSPPYSLAFGANSHKKCRCTLFTMCLSLSGNSTLMFSHPLVLLRAV
jgi:hypothetical protein